MAILLIDYIDAILNDALIFDVIKSTAPEFVGHSRVAGNFNASRNSYQILMFIILSHLVNGISNFTHN